MYIKFGPISHYLANFAILILSLLSIPIIQAKPLLILYSLFVFATIHWIPSKFDAHYVDIYKVIAIVRALLNSYDDLQDKVQFLVLAQQL